MRHLPGIFAIMILLLPACKKQPLAQAYISPNQAYVDELITFTNLSENAERVEWDMGDGTISNEFSPIYAYNTPGEYSVKLTAFGKKGDRDEAFYTVKVVARAPVADAVISPNPAWVGEEITFLNTSQNTSYVKWDLGDGTSSSANNVIHTYIDPGSYNVTLEAHNDFNDENVASFIVEVEGSELEVVVRELIDEYVIEGASVLLYASEDDWIEADIDKTVGGEQFTNNEGSCWFEGLSSQKYYVDVYYRIDNEGYVNWLLGEEDIYWVETQELPGGYDHTFIAYVEAVTFDSQKKSGGRPSFRSSNVHRFGVTDAAGILDKENKRSKAIERR